MGSSSMSRRRVDNVNETTGTAEGDSASPPARRQTLIFSILRVRARINAHSWASRRPYGKAREVNNI